MQPPKSISSYNKYMGVWGCRDQLLQRYEIARSSLKWYTKIAIPFLQLAMRQKILSTHGTHITRSRSQCVKIGNAVLSPVFPHGGVPQGTRLAPLLFPILANRL